jgi:hypothetical protein
MPIDPVLLIFITGVLTGVAAALFVGLAPDFVLILRHLIARRRTRGDAGRPLFPT